MNTYRQLTHIHNKLIFTIIDCSEVVVVMMYKMGNKKTKNLLRDTLDLCNFYWFFFIIIEINKINFYFRVFNNKTYYLSISRFIGILCVAMSITKSY